MLNKHTIKAGKDNPLIQIQPNIKKWLNQKTTDKYKQHRKKQVKNANNNRRRTKQCGTK